MELPTSNAIPILFDETLSLMHKGFFQYGIGATTLDDPRYEDYLLADREGLRHLKSKIDEVLDGADEVVFDSEEVVTELCGIRVAGRKDKPLAQSENSSVLATVGCIGVALLMSGVVVLGVWKAVELLIGN